MSTEELQETNTSDTTSNNYNDIPVHYCSNCKSLRILVYDEETSYCDVCGSTDIKEGHIEDVLKLQNQIKNGTRN